MLLLRSSTIRVSTPINNEDGGARAGQNLPLCLDFFNAIFRKTGQTAGLPYLELGRFMLD
jgi:hypothetical protein